MAGIELVTMIAGSAAAGLLGAIGSVVRARLDKRKALQEIIPSDAPTIEDRADELAEILKRSTLLLNELTAEIEARTVTAKEMEAKAKHAESLAAMHEEQRQAVAKLLDARLEARLEASGKKSFKQGMWLNIVSGAFFFAAGVITSTLL